MMENVNFVEVENESLRFYNYQLFQQVDSLREEIKILRKALEYYADIHTHWRTDDDAIEFDEGERARKALGFCTGGLCE